MPSSIAVLHRILVPVSSVQLRGWQLVFNLIIIYKSTCIPAMKTITLDAVDVNILIKCLNYVKNDCKIAKSFDAMEDSEYNKIISRIDYLLNKVQ